MRGMMQVAGIRDVKSIQSTGTRSIPKVQRSSYLELYMLKREKDRLEKEIYGLDKRRNTAKRQLDSISIRIEKQQKEIRQEQEIGTYRSIPTKPLKTMGISY